MKEWSEIPEFMKSVQVKEYYDILKRHQVSLYIKRITDIILALLLIVIFSPVLGFIAVLIKLDSRGPVFFRQVRITSYGKRFRIFKFRTMKNDADKIGTQVTIAGDSRVTKVGKVLRKYRIDELPQLFNVLTGDMSFVGTRPEVEKYVMMYTDEMKATLLLPAGITSLASIRYKDEENLLKDAVSADDVYIKQILPEKMKYNLAALKKFSLASEIQIMFDTVLAVIRD